MKKINNIEQVEKILEENNVKIKDPWLFYRFWNKVDIRDNKEECWNWLACVYPTGYGSFYVCGKSVLAHRFSYQLSKGDVQDKLQVQHICNNKMCCNPNHLELGNQSKNVRYVVDCGMWPKGENASRSILTEMQIREIYKMYNEQRRLHPCFKQWQIIVPISQKYCINTRTVNAIINGKRWSYIYKELKETVK